MRYGEQEVDNREAIEMAADTIIRDSVVREPLGAYKGRGGMKSPDGVPALTSNDPIYLQLAEIMRDRIFSKRWTAGSKIPSEHEMMEVFGVARGTVRKALKSLVDEGLLVQVRGSGTYVAEPGISHPAGVRPLSFADSLREQGKEFETQVLEQSISPASVEVATELGIEEGVEAMFMRRVRTVDGEPIMCQESWLNLRECPGLLDIDYTKESLFNAVQQCSGRKIKNSHMRYSARTAGIEYGELLGCSESAALLLLEQNICLEDGVCIEWTYTWFKPGQSIVGTAEQAD